MARILVGLLDPVMPKKMCEARKSLGLGTRAIPFEKLTPGVLVAGTELPEPTPLFPKIKISAKNESVVKDQLTENIESKAAREGKKVASF